MLVPERLLEVSIFVGERDLEAVTARLMHAAILHPDVAESEHWAPAPVWADLAESYRGLVQRLSRVRSALRLPDADPGTTPDMPLQPRPRDDRTDVDTTTLRFETRVDGWRKLFEAVEAEVAALRRMRHHHLTIGTLPSEHVERVAAALFQVAFRATRRALPGRARDRA